LDVFKALGSSLRWSDIGKKSLKTFFWIPNQVGDDEGRKIPAFAGTTRERG